MVLECQRHSYHQCNWITMALSALPTYAVRTTSLWNRSTRVNSAICIARYSL